MLRPGAVAVARNTFTGTLTRPKLIAPDQSARGMACEAARRAPRGSRGRIGPRRLDGQAVVRHGRRSVSRSRFQTFIGVDLGGGKGKNTAVALLRRHADGV